MKIKFKNNPTAYTAHHCGDCEGHLTELDNGLWRCQSDGYDFRRDNLGVFTYVPDPDYDECECHDRYLSDCPDFDPDDF